MDDTLVDLIPFSTITIDILLGVVLWAQPETAKAVGRDDLWERLMRNLRCGAVYSANQ